MNKVFQKAFEYSVHGYSVIPLGKNKLPIIKDVKKHQREICADEDQITKWWESYPEANVGICTGKISGITVVDVDVKIGNEEGKYTSLETFPETYTVKTPSGGYQLYYKYSAGIPNNANQYPNLPHIDIRNDGGYVVAPPSHCEYEKKGKKISGDYSIVKNKPLAEFPVHLFSKTGTKINNILKKLPQMKEGDGRNDAFASIIGKTLQMTPDSEIETVAYPLIIAANSLLKEPLKENELRTIFDSIVKRNAGKNDLPDIELLTTKKGVVIENEENVYRIIKNDALLKDKFRANTFMGTIETNYVREIFEPIQRADIVRIRTYLMRTYKFFPKVAHSMVEDAILKYSEENKVSPPVEYFKNLKWDEVSRLDEWLSSTYGVEKSEYHKAVGANWVKGLVKRIVHPGSKFDYVLVLEGKQGIKKSTSLAVLGGDWHCETVFTPDNKDFFMLFNGKAIIEFSEGETLSRTEAKRLKAIITMQYDKYRPPYERSAKDFPRHCVFAMTTNQEQYLKDETGNRRWLPVACKQEINIEWLKENRDQIFAEAYHRVITKKETTYEFPEAETERQQMMRQIADPREEQIFDWYYNLLKQHQRDLGVTTRMAFVEGVHAGSAFTKEMTKIDEMVIGGILKDYLKLDRRRTMNEGSRIYKYYPTEYSKKFENKVEKLLEESVPVQRGFGDFD